MEKGRQRDVGETNGERNTEALMAAVSKDHFLRNSQLCEQFNFFVGSNSL